MALEYSIPQANAAIVDGRGAPTREWYNFFRTLLGAQAGEDVDSEISALAERIAALEAHESFDFIVQGVGSIIVTGTPQSGVVQISMQGDASDPGASFYYGTDASGSKGWHALNAEAVTYDPTTSGLSSTDVQGAIDEIAAGGGSVPYFVASGDTYSVPENQQALFAMTIDCEGILAVDGYLIGVD